MKKLLKSSLLDVIYQINSDPRIFTFLYTRGGGANKKKTNDILRFSRRHDLFCSLFEDTFSTKSGKKNKKEQKEQKRSKEIRNHNLFCSFSRTRFYQIRHKNIDFEGVLIKAKKTKDILRFSGGIIRVVATTPEKTHNQKFLTFETIFNRFFVQF